MLSECGNQSVPCSDNVCGSPSSFEAYSDTGRNSGYGVLYIQIILLESRQRCFINYMQERFRAVGDSRHPFYYLVISSVLNIILDYLFIVPMNMGVAGAAWATVLSQLESGILCTWWFLTKTGVIERKRCFMAFSPYHAKKLCLIGLPMGFEYSVSAIGAVVMQGAINSLGSVAVAAQTAGEKIRQMFTLPMESVGMAMATYVGQNYGAKKIDRIYQGIRSGLTIQYSYCAVIWVVIFVLKAPLVGLVLSEINKCNSNRGGRVSDGYERFVFYSWLADDYEKYTAGPGLQHAGNYFRCGRIDWTKSGRYSGRKGTGIFRDLYCKSSGLGAGTLLLYCNGNLLFEKASITDTRIEKPLFVWKVQKTAAFCIARNFNCRYPVRYSG